MPRLKLTVSDKDYIKRNYDEKGIAELCSDLDCAEETVHLYLESLLENEEAEPEEEQEEVAEEQPKKPNNMNMVSKASGAVAMTKAMSERSDGLRPDKPENTARYKDAIHKPLG